MLTGSTINEMPITTGHITIDARGTLSVYKPHYGVDWRNHYEHRVALHLNTIRTSHTGAAVLGTIARSVTIRPLDDPFEDGASASPADRRNATQMNEPLIRCGKDPAPGTGTGLGSASTVYFTPGVYTRGDALQQYSPDAPASRPEEVLFHELVHAMRHTVGELDRSCMKDDFERKEEFHAIMICNIFCSERGRPLRRNHSGKQHMQRDFATDSFRFFAWYNREVRKFVADHPELSRQLNRINCPWNPIREHFQYAQVLREIARDRQTPRPGYY